MTIANQGQHILSFIKVKFLKTLVTHFEVNSLLVKELNKRLHVINYRSKLQLYIIFSILDFICTTNAVDYDEKLKIYLVYN